MGEKADNIWRDSETAKRFLNEVAGAIPLEKEQLEIMMLLIKKDRAEVKRFLDIGCGNGILGGVLLAGYPDAHGVLLDFSQTMLEAAKQKLGPYGSRIDLVRSDYGESRWLADLPETNNSKFDVIVSRLSIHHQPDERKKELYKEIYDLLEPNGIFVNIEHVSSDTRWGKEIFQHYMIDHIYSAQAQKPNAKAKDEIAGQFKQRHENDANVISSVGKQCQWLKDIGFSDVDCYFKMFELAIFAGRRLA